MDGEYRTVGIRCSITADENTPEAIDKATAELLEKILQENSLLKENIISVIFTLTADLNTEFPAKTARLSFGCDDVPMLCAQEIPVPSALSMCIRVLIHAGSKNTKIKHVYLKGAKKLRPDLA